jgi:hypothetical protein
MPEQIWIFKSAVHGGLIARREPHYYQYILDPTTGEDTVLLTSGEMIECPAWTSVRVTDGRSYGLSAGLVYDITDLVAAAATAATTAATSPAS